MRGLPELLSLVDGIYNTLEQESSKQQPTLTIPSLPVVFFEQRPTLGSLNRRPCPYASNKVTKAKNVQDFSIAFDVSSFQPEDISVKVKDRDIIVEARHEERQDERGYVSRQFTRRYTLPEEYDLDTVSTYLNADGKMTIKALKPKATEAHSERIIPIKRVTEQATHKKQKDSMENEKNGEEIAKQQQLEL